MRGQKVRELQVPTWPGVGQICAIPTPAGPRLYRVMKSSFARSIVEPLDGEELAQALAEHQERMAKEQGEIAAWNHGSALTAAARTYEALSWPARLLLRVQGRL